jgi:hypothetical protein
VEGSSTTTFIDGKPYLSAGPIVLRSRRLYLGPTYNSSDKACDSLATLETSATGSSGLARVVEVDEGAVGPLGQRVKTCLMGGLDGGGGLSSVDIT